MWMPETVCLRCNVQLKAAHMSSSLLIDGWLCRYLKKVETCVAAVKERTADGSPVTLLAHSAGGWLARVFLLGYGTADIDRLITIGSPHLPPPEVCLKSMILSAQQPLFSSMLMLCMALHGLRSFKSRSIRKYFAYPVDPAGILC